jgi:hypothetical protein
VTPRKPVDPDAITRGEAAALMGLTEMRVTHLRRLGLLKALPGYPSYSRSNVEEFISNPWIDGRQAASILGVSRTRVNQLAQAERIPYRVLASGRRVYRQRQIEVVANARNVRFHPDRF